MWVLGLVERIPQRKVFSILVVRRDQDTRVTIIRKYTYPGPIIHTDFWRGHNGIEDHYIHHEINHSLRYVEGESGTHINAIEGIWSASNLTFQKDGEQKIKISC